MPQLLQIPMRILAALRIPITTLKPEAVYDVPGAPDWMAADKEMWVSNSPKGTMSRLDPPITRIDPSTNTVAQQFVGEGGDAIRVGLGWIWLTNLRAGTVWRLDPKRILATLAE